MYKQSPFKRLMLAALAVASGRLPQILEVVRKAQLQLIQDTLDTSEFPAADDDNFPTSVQ